MLAALVLVGCGPRLTDAERERIFDAANVHAHAAYEAVRDSAPRDVESSSTVDDDVAPGVHLEAGVFSEEYPVGIRTFYTNAEGTLTFTGAAADGVVLDGELDAVLHHYEEVEADDVVTVEVSLAGEVVATGEVEAEVELDYSWTVALDGAYYTWVAAGELDGVPVSTFGESPLPEADWNKPCEDPLPEVVIESVDFSCDGDAGRYLTVANAPIDRLCVYFVPGADQPATFCSGIYDHPAGSCTNSGGSCYLDEEYPNIKIEAWSDGDDIADEFDGGGHELVDCVVLGPDPTAHGCGCRPLDALEGGGECERPVD